VFKYSTLTHLFLCSSFLFANCSAVRFKYKGEGISVGKDQKGLNLWYSCSINSAINVEIDLTKYIVNFSFLFLFLFVYLLFVFFFQPLIFLLSSTRCFFPLPFHNSLSPFTSFLIPKDCFFPAYSTYLSFSFHPLSLLFSVILSLFPLHRSFFFFFHSCCRYVLMDNVFFDPICLRLLLSPNSIDPYLEYFSFFLIVFFCFVIYMVTCCM
jgi:hypothetical protein